MKEKDGNEYELIDIDLLTQIEIEQRELTMSLFPEEMSNRLTILLIMEKEILEKEEAKECEIGCIEECIEEYFSNVIDGEKPTEQQMKALIYLYSNRYEEKIYMNPVLRKHIRIENITK